ncbi:MULTISPECIES: YicC/YloC family endoribonuclease [unclassified Ereboglobus]|uniref:YicC/YloC family endoribonuclease n=1 Tax=unclassified Ereboglobus TaxID=2626932 RepID=UPI002406D264|nr:MULTISPECIES: YicC/YloC family endoribonuclease [unclassified Ereboglobus]
MKSMTGFGRATAPLGTSTLTVQVNSVNRKTLDLAISLPSEWAEYEAPAGELARKYAARGKINIRFDVTGADGAQSQAFNWDEAAVDAVLERLKAQAARNGVGLEITPELLWSVVGSQRKKADLPAGDDVRATVLATLEEALRAFSSMRAREGAALLADFEDRIQKINTHVRSVAELAPCVAPAWREQLLKRLRDAGLEINPDDERVLKEVALFADRCDIAEEITRLRSHLSQFAALLRGDAEIGRKAEFILQEMGREVNTIGSKANNIEISRRVIEMKNELERVREQIANIE